jgi:hypothetical protein
MSWDDIKIYGLNAFTLIFSFSAVESILKIILLVASIIYTLIQIKEKLKK